MITIDWIKSALPKFFDIIYVLSNVGSSSTYFPRPANVVILSKTKKRAAPNKERDTIFSSASSFIRIDGNNNAAKMIIIHILTVAS